MYFEHASFPRCILAKCYSATSFMYVFCSECSNSLCSSTAGVRTERSGPMSSAGVTVPAVGSESVPCALCCAAPPAQDPASDLYYRTANMLFNHTVTTIYRQVLS